MWTKRGKISLISNEFSHSMYVHTIKVSVDGCVDQWTDVVSTNFTIVKCFQTLP